MFEYGHPEKKVKIQSRCCPACGEMHIKEPMEINVLNFFYDIEKNYKLN